MQLNVGVRRGRLDVQVYIPIELLDRAYGSATAARQMMNKNIITQLEQIAGKDGVLHTPEDLAVYSYDGTFEEHCPGCGRPARAPQSRSARL